MSVVTYTYFISKDGGEYLEYNQEPLEEIGEYKLKVIAVDVNGKSQSKIIGFEIVGATTPEVSDIFIRETDALGVGAILQGEYVYFDINDEIADANKDYCTFQWYRSDKKDGEYVAISGATSESYTLTEADEDKYIKLGVKPFSKVEPKEGKEYLSKPFVSFMNPEVTNISIKGKMATDESLTVDYDYSDLNGDAEITEGESATVVIWYTSDTSNGEYSEVGRGLNYTLKEEDKNKYIKVVVIPKNNGGGKQDKQFESKAIEGVFSPTVQDVKMNGNFNVGSKIGVDYRFYDVNGDTENGSIIEWYVDGKLVSDDEHYTIESKDAGKSIYVSITPKTNVKPTTGVAVKSDAKTVSKNANIVRPGGSGGGGGGSNGGGNVIPPTGGNTDNTDTSKGFGDISGTREEMAVVICAITSEKGIESDASDVSFADDDNISAWAKNAVSTMAKLGIINGMGDNKFEPSGDATGAQTVVMLTRLQEVLGR